MICLGRIMFWLGTSCFVREHHALFWGHHVLVCARRVFVGGSVNQSVSVLFYACSQRGVWRQHALFAT